LVWKIKFKETAKKEFFKLDRKWQKKILDYLDEIAMLENPKSRGKPLIGDKKGFWRYRIGDYRVICDLQDGNLVILVLVIGHRKEIYD
jgi:mRNA interferase RelE/StbE